MATEWIKVEETLPEKREVIAMAARLGIERERVVGCCIRVWIWARQNSSDGSVTGVTPEFIDELVRCKGFAEAMQQVGWLQFEKETLTFPNWERHNSQGAKARSLAADRSRRYRDRRHDVRHPTDVTAENGSITPQPSPEKSKSTTTVSRTNSSSSSTERRRATTTTSSNDGENTTETVPCREIVDAWNEICAPALRQVRFANGTRARMLSEFWTWVGKDLDSVRAVFTRVARSRLLHGDRPAHWRKTDRKAYKTNFEWVIRPENATRVAEGHYDDEYED